MLTPFILHIPYLPSRLRDRLLLTFSLLPSPPLTIPQELAEFNSATEAHLYTREPSTVLAIRQTNDWVLKICISGSLTLCSTRGTVQISQDSAFFGNFGDNSVALIHSRNY